MWDRADREAVVDLSEKPLTEPFTITVSWREQRVITLPFTVEGDHEGSSYIEERAGKFYLCNRTFKDKTPFIEQEKTLDEVKDAIVAALKTPMSERFPGRRR